ncbi:MAG: integrin alpha, partial [Planctomycetota bacterium]
VSGVGDLNGDGLDEFIVGAPEVDFSRRLSNAGRACIFSPSAPFLLVDLQDGSPVAWARARGLRPGEDTFLFASGRLNKQKFLPGLNVTLDIGGRLFQKGPRPAGAAGELSWHLEFPAKVFGSPGWLQAAQFGLKTNVTGAIPFR